MSSSFIYLFLSLDENENMGVQYGLVLHGHHDFSWLFREMDQTMGQTGEFDIAEYYRLHLAVEKIR